MDAADHQSNQQTAAWWRRYSSEISEGQSPRGAGLAPARGAGLWSHPAPSSHTELRLVARQDASACEETVRPAGHTDRGAEAGDPGGVRAVRCGGDRVDFDQRPLGDHARHGLR